jgi:hypothetical protein
MYYTTVNGGTFEVTREENSKLITKSYDVPKSMGEFIKLLETKTNKSIDNLTFQICPTQHLSEERVVFNYIVNSQTFETSKEIIKVSNMNFYEKLRYDEVLTQAKNNNTPKIINLDDVISNS